MMILHKMLMLFLIFEFAGVIHGTILDEMYTTLPEKDISFCIRRLNKTGNFGCSSDMGGNVGVIRKIDSEQDFAHFVKEKTSASSILVITTKLFVMQDFMMKVRSFHKSHNINGLLILDDTRNETSIRFSEDEKKPNQKYQSDKKAKALNIFGSGYASLQWPFPMAVIYDEKARTEITECYERFNVNASSKVRCAVELTAAMSAVKNAVVCDRRTNEMQMSVIRLQPTVFCRVVPADNTLLPVITRTDPKNMSGVTIVLTRLDVKSLFGPSYGTRALFVSAAATLMSSLNIYHAAKQMNDTNSNGLLFGFMSGESMDYLSSLMLAHDIFDKKGLDLNDLQVTKKNLKAIIEVGHLGSQSNETKNVYMKTLQPTAYFDAIFQAFDKPLFSPAKVSDRNLFPECSIQPFLLHGYAGQAMHLSEDKAFVENGLYHTYFDRYLPEDAVQATEVAERLTKGIFKLNYGKDFDLEDNYSALANELVDCLTGNNSCELFKKVFLPSTLTKFNYRPDGPISATHLPLIVNHIAKYFTATVLPAKDSDECDNWKAAANLKKEELKYQFYDGRTRCFMTPVITYSYTKNAFAEANDSISAKYGYPMWRESSSIDLKVRLFVLPSAGWELATLLTGIFLLLGTIAGILLLQYFGPAFLKDILIA